MCFIYMAMLIWFKGVIDIFFIDFDLLLHFVKLLCREKPKINVTEEIQLHRFYPKLVVESVHVWLDTQKRKYFFRGMTCNIHGNKDLIDKSSQQFFE